MHLCIVGQQKSSCYQRHWRLCIGRAGFRVYREPCMNGRAAKGIINASFFPHFSSFHRKCVFTFLQPMFCWPRHSMEHPTPISCAEGLPVACAHREPWACRCTLLIGHRCHVTCTGQHVVNILVQMALVDHFISGIFDRKLLQKQCSIMACQ